MCMSGLPPSARRVHLPAVPCRSKCCVCVLLELEQHSHPTHPPPAEQGKNSTQHISNDPRQNVPTSELTKSATTGSSGLFWSQPWGSIFQGVAGENECPYSSYSKHILCITMALQCRSQVSVCCCFFIRSWIWKSTSPFWNCCWHLYII